MQNTNQNPEIATGNQVGGNLILTSLRWAREVGEEKSMNPEEKGFIINIIAEQLRDDLTEGKKESSFSTPPHRYALLQRRVAKRLAVLRRSPPRHGGNAGKPLPLLRGRSAD